MPASVGGSWGDDDEGCAILHVGMDAFFASVVNSFVGEVSLVAFFPSIFNRNVSDATSSKTAALTVPDDNALAKVVGKVLSASAAFAAAALFNAISAFRAAVFHATGAHSRPTNLRPDLSLHSLYFNLTLTEMTGVELSPP